MQRRPIALAAVLAGIALGVFLLWRGLRAPFDCSDAKRDLGWAPLADPTGFREAAFATGP